MASNIIPLPQGPRGKLVQNVVKYGGMLGLGLLVAPIILTAIGGLIGLGVAVALIWAGGMFAPVVSLKISNLATKYLIQEIRENPVESRMKVYGEKYELLQQYEQQLQDFNRAIKQYASKLDSLKKAHPEDTKKFEAHLKVMEDLLDVRVAGYKKAVADLAAYQKMTERVRAIWEMTLASDQMNKAAGKMNVDTRLMQIINDETIRAADEGMARSFADLDHLLRMEKIDEAGKLPSGGQIQSIELERAEDGGFVLPDLSVKQPVRVRA